MQEVTSENLYTRFHERPLRLEITATVDAYSSLITTHLIWPIIFTQQMIAIVRRSAPASSPLASDR